jgi:hypothetical protein
MKPATENFRFLQSGQSVTAPLAFGERAIDETAHQHLFVTGTLIVVVLKQKLRCRHSSRAQGLRSHRRVLPPDRPRHR